MEWKKRQVASRTFLLIGAALAILFLLSFSSLSHYYLDFLWFQSQGQASVWWKRIYIRGVFYLLGFTLSFVTYIVSYYIARIRLGFYFRTGPSAQIIRNVFIAVAFVLSALIHANVMQDLTTQLIMVLYGKDFGLVDPVYGLDASFYMLKLDAMISLLHWFQLLLLFLLAYSAAPYLISLRGIDLVRDRQRLIQTVHRALPHLALLGGLFLFSLTVGIFFSKYSMVYHGNSPAVAGASFTDVYARGGAYTVFFYLGIIISLAIVVGAFLDRWIIPAVALPAWILLRIAVLNLIPGMVQTFKVNPNEFTAEKPYIENSIHFTRIAYGLDSIARERFDAKDRFTAADLQANPGVIDHIRLWDYRPIAATFKQLQEIRLYYEFHDVDVDRYMVDGKMRQVMVSARELESSHLPDQARTWIPRHLQYTHGYGMVMAPANRVTLEGLPELWVKDFPPVRTHRDLPEIKTPGIYFGELSADYAVVNTSMKEIDYPREGQFAETEYSGDGGIQLGNGLRRLFISWNFDTWKLLISEYVDSQSRILFRRNIVEAVQELVPFLTLDPDPYLVVGDDGKLYWILDAYTVSQKFPYSERFDSSFLNKFKLGKHGRLENDLYDINYIRNSAKIVVDAYTGKITIYTFDTRDPILGAWRGFYPTLFHSMKEMPEFIKSHLRYPETYFLTQAAIYRDYHMNDSRSFYNREDRWQVATEIYDGNQMAVEPYYTVARLPGSKKEEYILMLPFTPNNKQNLIAWMAVRCDYGETKPGKSSSAGEYGQVLVYDFPRTRQIYGTIQIESRIDQNPDISRDLTLWNQEGSRVIRGNLLVIPVGDTLLYAEPIYLYSTHSPFPELKRVIVADSRALVMSETLSGALSELSQSTLAPGDDQDTTIQTMDLSTMIRRARESLERARKSAGAGQWTRFGQSMDELEELLQRMSSGK